MALEDRSRVDKLRLGQLSIEVEDQKEDVLGPDTDSKFTISYLLPSSSYSSSSLSIYISFSLYLSISLFLSIYISLSFFSLFLGDNNERDVQFGERGRGEGEGRERKTI